MTVEQLILNNPLWQHWHTLSKQTKTIDDELRLTIELALTLQKLFDDEQREMQRLRLEHESFTREHANQFTKTLEQLDAQQAPQYPNVLPEIVPMHGMPQDDEDCESLLSQFQHDDEQPRSLERFLLDDDTGPKQPYLGED